MKNRFFAAITALFLFASCSQKENNNTETSIHARADSAIGVQMQEINQRAMDDLEKRMAIEVKAKADSIVAARKGGLPAARKDSMSTRPNTPPPPSKMKYSNDTARH